MTDLPATVVGRWHHRYLIRDLFSRKIVGAEGHETDAAEHAAHLVRRTALAEGIAARATKPVLHGDNGATFKATMVLARLHWLGVKPAYSRPRVSDDKAEAWFRTAKYRPEFPAQGFADLDATRHALYQTAREANPARCSGQTGNCSPSHAVTLNQERDSVIAAATASTTNMRLAV
ncbi:MAG: hypothetical protein JNK99_11600 [Candidatus Accumulibacter sp.]|uniref:hypothetical protein n=1 Tax=Accumulibacter sp. TaxID=2053492 RepID=UPI001A47C619|nr:hypothetical protein [Accumulibacter sp.]MBL8395371.1 hypothetical protein [Accumulibacter sp.]